MSCATSSTPRMTGAEGSHAGAAAVMGADAAEALASGRYAEARDLLERAAVGGTASSRALHVLGELHYKFGDKEAAEVRLRQAVTADPSFVQAAFALGMLLNREQRFPEARAVLEDAAARMPDHEGVLFNLAEAMDGMGDRTGSAALYERVVAINPRNGRALNNLGNLLDAEDRLAEASDLYRRATTAEPRLAPAWTNLARAAEILGETAEAEAAHRQSIALTGLDSKSGRIYAEFLIRSDRPGDAEQVLRQCLGKDPDNAGLHAALASALSFRGLQEDGIAAAERALELDPELAEAWAHLGRICGTLGQHDRQAEALEKALELGGDPIVLHREAGQAHRAAKRMGEALKHFILAAIPEEQLKEPLDAILEAVKTTGEAPDWLVEATAALPDQDKRVISLTGLATFFGALGRHRSMRRLFQAIAPEVQRRQVVWSGFAFNANYDPELTAEDLFAHYLAHPDLAEASAAEVAPPAALPAPAALAGRKLRVGYLSPDFRTHSMINFILPILENHDRSEFEIHAYAELKVGDSQTRVVQDLVDGWRLTTRVSDADVAAAIRADGIDVLVDLAGHTAGHRLGVFRHRPAPVTATWLGYLYTTAMPGVDYFLGDCITSPPEAAHLFSEALVRLPHYTACFRPSEKAPTEVPAPPAAANGFVTFGNCSRPVRCNDSVLRAWARILAGAPTARLRLDHPDYADPWSASFMRARLQDAGLPLDRVDVLHSGEYWGFYGTVDVVLDTFPHASGTTTCEAMYMGVPVLTVTDRPPVGRLGAAMVDTVGHPEWIGWNESDYVRKATRLAADIGRLRRIRASLRDELLASPICDGPRFVRNVEQAYRMMWENARRGVRCALEVPDVASGRMAVSG